MVAYLAAGEKKMHVSSVTDYESQVRYYCRHYPARFQTASGAFMYDVHGARFIDFLSGCGALQLRPQ